MVVRLLVVLSLLLAGRPALAESDKLAAARAAVDAVQYDDAQRLLVEALKAGARSPTEVAEIYRLSASTAIVLGQADVAEQYYRRWLVLDPTATLPASVAPKLREPFVAAQAYMAAHGRLSVTAQRRGDAIEVVVVSDPLGMVATVALDGESSQVPGADGTVRFAGITRPHASIVLLDEFGNRLIEIPDGQIAPLVERRRDDVAVGSRRTTPLYRRPIVWGIAGSAFVVAGAAFGLAARSANAEVAAIAAMPGAYFASELDAARDRRDRRALFANVGFIAAGACAVTAAVMWATRSPAGVAVVPGPAGASLVLARSF